MATARRMSSEIRILHAMELIIKQFNWSKYHEHGLSVVLQVLTWVIERWVDSAMTKVQHQQQYTVNTQHYAQQEIPTSTPVALLQYVVDATLQSDSGRHAIGQHLRLVCGTLCMTFEQLAAPVSKASNSRVGSTTTAIDTSSFLMWRSSLTNVLTSLLLTSPSDVDCYVVKVDMPPNYDELSSVRTALQQRIDRCETDLISGSDIQADILQGVQYLRQCIVSGNAKPILKAVEQLRTIMQSDDATEFWQSKVVQHDSCLKSLIGVLVGLCRSEHQDSAVHSEALRALGDIGAINPYSIQLSSIDYRLSTTAATVTTSSSTTTTNSSDPLFSLKMNALKLLSTCMTSHDAVLSEKAMQTVKAILVQDTGVELLNSSTDSDMIALLQPFAQDKVIVDRPIMKQLRLSRQESTAMIQQQYTAFTDDTWSISGKSFNTWICALMYALIKECYSNDSTNNSNRAPAIARQNSSSSSTTTAYNYAYSDVKGDDSFISACGSMCAYQAEFAAYLFPAVVYDLIRTNKQSGSSSSSSSSSSRRNSSSGDTNKAIQALTEQFSKHIINSSANSNKQAVQLAIEALNFLRECQVSCTEHYCHGCHCILHGTYVSQKCLYATHMM
jgi:hypothetical protein